MKKLLYLLFVFTTICHSQGSKVKVHEKATEKQISDYKILKIIEEKSKKLWEDIHSTGFLRLVPQGLCNSKKSCNSELELLNKRKRLINSITYYGRAMEIDNLKIKIGIKPTYVKKYEAELHRYDKFESELQSKISEINAKDNDNKNEKNNKQRFKEVNKSLNDELSEIGSSTVKLTKDINKSKSLDDFLANSNLKSKKHKSNIDFLDESTNETDDFLSEEKEEEKITDYNITKKQDKEGVENVKGKILIPHKFDKILEFNDGVAKVSIIVEKREVRTEWNNVTLAVKKVGFVDKTGEFLDNPKHILEDITIRSGGSGNRTYLTLETDYSKETREERSRRLASEERYRREQERQKRENIRKAKEFNSKLESARNYLISKYNIK